jgi:alanine-alpha-ketoisovalerate/valine-pyruvate aminotransferase
MNILSLLSGKDPIELAKEYIEKIYIHEAKKYHCNPSDISFILVRDETGKIEILVYSRPGNKTLRVLPDKEVQEILTK